MKKVYILFGGNTAERQVSVMSGTNVWLKLGQSKIYDPSPFFLSPDEKVWPLPYTFALSHTAEEIWHNCQYASSIQQNLAPYVGNIRHRLGLDDTQDDLSIDSIPLPEFIQKAKDDDAFVFIALHGGMGEDGTLQTMLSQAGVKYNGSGSEGSSICMDKWLTTQTVNNLSIEGVYGLSKILIDLNTSDLLQIPWEKEKTWIIKPQNDGCSAGVVRLFSQQDLDLYLDLLRDKVAYIPAGTLTHQHDIVEISPQTGTKFMVEPFIETDRLSIENDHIHHTVIHGWIELTVGVLEHQGTYRSLSPSITIAKSHVLSVEEKFQGGTGVNLTPPPEYIISAQQISRIKNIIQHVAQGLHIQNYARIDIFFNHMTNDIAIIEANSLPALTPSTVIYHQALAENPPIPPQKFLENIVTYGVS